ncbi:sensor histidine kinase [Devosia chinhatensis]|uniref:sensor histidine kinase n=1 Tax=Devosia chinhatensis TaxID=429727 RepID=UPI000A88ECA1|nr:CHASE3 domain-containing protein [Devosia chinhatensis]
MRRVAIWVSLALVCLAALGSLLQMRFIEQQIADITQSHALRTSARELSHAVSQAEANQRGFLLTGNAQFLELYNTARLTVNQRVEGLSMLSQNEPEQGAPMRIIVEDIGAKMSEMARAVTAAEEANAGPGPWQAETILAAPMMGEVSQTLERFIAEEDAKLVARNAAIDGGRKALVAALIFALGASVTLAWALMSRSQRQISVLAKNQMGLRTQNEALEVQVADRIRDLEEARANAEREQLRVEALLQDTNHRVGNSLTTVSSLLALQAMRSPSQDVQDALEAARLRIHAIASAHRRLRLTDDLETASAQDFLGNVIEDLATTQPDNKRLTLHSEIEPINVSARDATTLGILVGELVTNAIKHGFPDRRAGTISVRLFRAENGIPHLRVRDDGVGLGQDPSGEGGLGSVIVRQLASQFGGEPHYDTSLSGGVEVNISLPGLMQTSHPSLEP